jgi:Protein  of unknown function (DUF3018)
MGVHENLTGAQRAARYRAAKRAQGLRLKQIWVPDLRDPKVLAGIECGIAAINAGEEEIAYNRWLDANFDELMADEPDYDWGPNGPPRAQPRGG